MDWPVAEWIEAVGGELIAGRPETRIRGVSTDSRKLAPNQLFVALRGPTFDGHDFCTEAVGKGAAALMVSRAEVARSVKEGVAVVLVEDTLAALGRLASAYRSRFSPRLVALSGSCGKTTTKEMLRPIVEPIGGLVTPGNYNNRIGVPLTIFHLEPHNVVAVFELAMSLPGELRILTEIVRPELVALTNVGVAHIGNFESYEALREAKAEMIVAAPAARVVMNADCTGCQWIAERYCKDRDVVTFGIEEPADFRAENIEPVDPVGYKFDLVTPEERATVTLKVFGRQNIANAVCAAAIATLLGIDLERICGGLEHFRAAPLRCEILEIGGVTVVADCYNANPDSVAAALQSLDDFARDRRCVFLFADMLELGDEAEMAHREVGQEVADHRIALFATTGELAQLASWEAARMGVRAGHFESNEAVARALAEELRRGDVLLVKGSRLMGLENVIRRLEELL